MVKKQTNLTSGMIHFYNQNGKKEEVTQRLGLIQGNWNKKLEALYPGEFEVEKNIVYLRAEMSVHSKQPKSKIQDKKGKGAKKVSRAETNLKQNITSWQQRVRNFKGKALGRKVPKTVRNNALGQPCPTCGIQMTNEKGPQTVTNEHIIPLSIGGDNTCKGDFPQVIAMCKSCNTARNQVVMSLKTSNKDQLVQFLITQVYGSTEQLDKTMLEKFRTAYQSISGRKINSIPMPKSGLTLLITGFCGNNPSPVLHNVYENLKIVPENIIVLLEQKDSGLFDFDKWSQHVSEVQLIPSGNDNLQVSALAVLDDEKSAHYACLVTSEKSSISFEKILLSRGIHCLKTGGVQGHTTSWLRRALSALLPWNWGAKKNQQLDYEVKRNQTEEEKVLSQPESVIEAVSPPEVKTKPSPKMKAVKKTVKSTRTLKHPLEKFRNRILKRRKTNTYKDGFPISAITYILRQLKEEMELTWTEYFLHFNLKEGSMREKATSIMEMTGIEYETNSESGDLVFVLNETQPKFVPFMAPETKIEIPATGMDLFTDPQMDVIERAKNKIIEEIQSFEKEGKEFKSSNLSRVYIDFGGSIGFKETLNIPKKTKLLEMFEMLFGNYFTISGTSPGWNIKISKQGETSDEQE
tara:strand:+ start:678 stop:2579 length:1902 start_codon:yes stop_codon:yes gene_type:complete